MVFNCYDSTSMAYIGNLDITIDVTHAAIRTLTQTAFTGTAGADAFTLNGSPITALPTNALVGAFMSWATAGYTQTQYANYLMPVIEWENIFDCGAVSESYDQPG